jgi:hypothetical protein
MKTILLATAILIAVPALGQEVEHAPTVAQCQADQRLWLSRLEGDDSPKLADVTVITLMKWENETHQCEVVDPQNQHKYYNTWGEATAVESLRELNFIKRHGLGAQFIAEDAAGKRE